MSPTPKKFKRPDNAPLPKPNVEFATAADAGDMTPEKVRGMVCNPIYAGGIGPFPGLVSEREWIENVRKDTDIKLADTEADFEKALELLKIKGVAKATKKASRVTPEGSITSYIHAGGKNLHLPHLGDVKGEGRAVQLFQPPGDVLQGGKTN